MGSYDVLVGMDWLETCHIVINFLVKTLSCIDGKWSSYFIKCIFKPVFIRQIIEVKLKKCTKKGCQLYVVQILNVEKDSKNLVLEDTLVLKEFQDVFP